ncbi:MAG: hypothetical protein ACLFPX_05040 [Candidatus Omnitrophota bacterium]
MRNRLQVLMAACIVFMLHAVPPVFSSSHQGPVCAVYITGIGCGNCAVTDPVLLTEATGANPDLILFEYEIYHSRGANKDAADQYFQNYASGRRSGVPFLIFSQDKSFIGRFKVLKAAGRLTRMTENRFPGPDGTPVSFDELDLTAMPGAVKIWTKNRVLVHGRGGDNKVLKRVLLAENLSHALRDADYAEVAPEPVQISHSEIQFDHAVKIGGWRLQWTGEPLSVAPPAKGSAEKWNVVMLFSLLVIAVSLSFFKIRQRKTKKGAPVSFEFRGRFRDFMIVVVSLAALLFFFLSAKNISPSFLEQMGYRLPLPVFTFLIALVDGFNPCNMFVLTCLLAVLISTSDVRKRLYIVSVSFVAMVYIFYFMFMALWLNVFKYISFITPLRIGLGIVAVGAGLINCKELFFFKKGISLTIQDRHKGPLMKRIQGMREIIEKGSYPLLISSSLGLAALASLVELPCTAGFPIIYTGILSGKGLENSAVYYVYLIFYNLVYVMPLCVIILIFIYTLKVRQVTQRQMEIIKFIGGVIMLLLGIVLLVNPGLLGIRLG